MVNRAVPQLINSSRPDTSLTWSFLAESALRGISSPDTEKVPRLSAVCGGRPASGLHSRSERRVLRRTTVHAFPLHEATCSDQYADGVSCEAGDHPPSAKALIVVICFLTVK